MPRLMKPSSAERLQMRAEVHRKASEGELRLPEAFREIRKSLGLTQAEFAEKFHLTRSQVIALEKGTANPTLETLQRLVAPFGFTTGFVLKRKEQA